VGPYADHGERIAADGVPADARYVRSGGSGLSLQFVIPTVMGALRVALSRMV